MDQQQAFDKINGMLAETDYPETITSIRDIESFLLDDSNRRFIDQFVAIGRIYDDLSGRPDIDRYPEPSQIKYEEQIKSTQNKH